MIAATASAKQREKERQTGYEVERQAEISDERAERRPACTPPETKNPEAFSPPAPSNHSGAPTLCKHLQLIEKCKISRRIDR